MSKEAVLYKKTANLEVECFLCSHFCRIKEGKFGFCGVRQNIKGVLYTHSYGKVIAKNIDPIEKKPIFHMLPGSSSFSIATLGCNFRCGFCQNWQISQIKEIEDLNRKVYDIKPEEIVREAKESNCKSISYTYTEPTIFFEYAFDIAKLAKKEGLYNIFVTNGYMTKEALELIKPYLDAANVDLKFFNNDGYKRVCAGSLRPVLETIDLMHKLNIWVEVTTLVIPGENDSAKELKGIAEFLVSVGKEIPWHVSRFHPDYKLTNLSPTPLEKLEEAYEIGKMAGLKYVYVGNVLEEEKTYCASCRKDLIVRSSFGVITNNLKNGKCPKCGTVLDGLAL
ncbi:MAG: AmmeMemoRadiSam system radical SAM enzyme [Candidatus Omnitrophota bacterium]